MRDFRDEDMLVNVWLWIQAGGNGRCDGVGEMKDRLLSGMASAVVVWVWEIRETAGAVTLA